MDATIPVGLCQCGCGKPTKIEPQTYRSRGIKKGDPRKYLKGHHPQAWHRPESIADRFWSRVDKSAGPPAHRPELGSCWAFTGSDRGPRGHSRMHVRKRRVQVHRFSWEVHNGPIPAGLEVLHRCDNGACVRPDHLFLGTQADNMRDMVSKGRQVRGDRHPARLRKVGAL